MARAVLSECRRCEIASKFAATPFRISPPFQNAGRHQEGLNVRREFKHHRFEAGLGDHTQSRLPITRLRLPLFSETVAVRNPVPIDSSMAAPLTDNERLEKAQTREIHISTDHAYSDRRIPPDRGRAGRARQPRPTALTGGRHRQRHDGLSLS